MGEECPLPGNGIFQRILLVSLQRIGGLACGATPLANGPRHCGQLFKSAALSQAPPPSASADTASRQPRLGNNRDEGIIHDLYTPCSSRLKAAIPLPVPDACPEVCLRNRHRARNGRSKPAREGRMKRSHFEG